MFGWKKKQQVSPERDAVTWKFSEIEVTQDKDLPDFLSLINQAKIDGVIIKNALPKLQLDKINDKIDALKNIMVEATDFGCVVGRTLDGCARTDLESAYFPETDRISNFFNQVLGIKVEKLFESVVTKISGDRKVTQPVYSNGDKYKAATLRISKPGREGMQSHIGNEFITYLPQLEHIAGVVDPKDRFSFFFLLQKPEIGGELVVFDLVWKNTPEHLVADMAVVKKKLEREEYLNNFKSMNVNMDAGDLLIFDGGRIWHRVRPSEGDMDRITLGGYGGISRDGKGFNYWS